jgi:hypothetical protein
MLGSQTAAFVGSYARTRGEIGTHINKQSLTFRPGHVQHSEVRMM